jgi:glycosyltransferase involved in cell wall biosynthesis
MALGLPVIVNDNPDQAQVIRESGAGLCVSLEPGAFAGALLELLGDPARRREMGEKGRRYVVKVRGYDKLAETVAATYKRLLDGSNENEIPTRHGYGSKA